uniref:Uncharacterized protein n=1 Tax=Glossina palpalis gambiensis TaxID=67801 RepID=A0A1B0B7M5_9MUSC
FERKKVFIVVNLEEKKKKRKKKSYSREIKCNDLASQHLCRSKTDDEIKHFILKYIHLAVAREKRNAFSQFLNHVSCHRLAIVENISVRPSSSHLDWLVFSSFKKEGRKHANA